MSDAKSNGNNDGSLKSTAISKGLAPISPPKVSIDISSSSKRNRVEVSNESTCREALIFVFNELGIPLEHLDVMALWAFWKPAESNGTGHVKSEIAVQLDDDQVLNSVEKPSVMKTGQTWKVTFRMARNGLHYGTSDAEIENETLMDSLYVECRQKRKENVYPIKSLNKLIGECLRLEKNCDLDEKQNGNNVENDQAESIEIDFEKEALNVCNNYQNTITRKRVVRQISKLSGKPQFQENSLKKNRSPKREYLEFCQKNFPCYGGFVFDGQMERSLVEILFHGFDYCDKKVKIVVNQNGLHIITIQCPKIKMTIPMKDLYYGRYIPHREFHFQCLFIKTPNKLELMKVFTVSVTPIMEAIHKILTLKLDSSTPRRMSASKSNSQENSLTLSSMMNKMFKEEMDEVKTPTEEEARPLSWQSNQCSPQSPIHQPPREQTAF